MNNTTTNTNVTVNDVTVMGIKERFQTYALATINNHEAGSIENVKNFLTELIEESYGTPVVSVISDTMYDHETGMHKGISEGCFWVD